MERLEKLFDELSNKSKLVLYGYALYKLRTTERVLESSAPELTPFFCPGDGEDEHFYVLKNEVMGLVFSHAGFKEGE